MTREIVLVVDNVRSTHNVGSFFRSCDGFGVSKIYLCGITPYPRQTADARLPYLADKIDKQISKTALGAEKTVAWEFNESVVPILERLRADGFQIIALEQTKTSVPIQELKTGEKVALVVGNEIDGVSAEALGVADTHAEIAMTGKKESFNVSVATGIALFYFSVFRL